MAKQFTIPLAFDSPMVSIPLVLRKRGRLLKRTAIAVLPSFVQARLSPAASPSATPTIKTSGVHVLDGLRGVACLIVFNEHYTRPYTDTFHYGYGIDGRRSFVQWPFVRVMWSGTAMVTIFFVISGYVLSYKSLRHIQDRTAPHKLPRILASSTFRRAIRLYLPAATLVLICGFVAWAGGFRSASAVRQAKPSLLAEGSEHTPPQFDSFPVQMGDALQKVWIMSNFWQWDVVIGPGIYDGHLWTIPVELRCSMVLFLTLIATSHLRQKVRFSYVLLFIAYCVATERRDIMLFLCGMLMAEIDLLYRAIDASNGRQPSRWNLRKVLSPALFLLGLFLAGLPSSGGPETPGYRTLVAMTSRFPSGGGFLDKPGSIIECAGAVLIVWSVTIATSTSSLTSLFMSVPAQYLGSISFALYLVHGCVLRSLHYSIMPWLVKIIHAFNTRNEAGELSSRGTTAGFVIAWLIGLVAILPVTLWAADLFWRGVDETCIAFARWLEQRCVEQHGDDFQTQYRHLEPGGDSLNTGTMAMC